MCSGVYCSCPTKGPEIVLSAHFVLLPFDLVLSLSQFYCGGNSAVERLSDSLKFIQLRSARSGEPVSAISRTWVFNQNIFLSLRWQSRMRSVHHSMQDLGWEEDQGCTGYCLQLILLGSDQLFAQEFVWSETIWSHAYPHDKLWVLCVPGAKRQGGGKWVGMILLSVSEPRQSSRGSRGQAEGLLRL